MYKFSSVKLEEDKQQFIFFIFQQTSNKFSTSVVIDVGWYVLPSGESTKY